MNKEKFLHCERKENSGFDSFYSNVAPIINHFLDKMILVNLESSLKQMKEELMKGTKASMKFFEGYSKEFTIRYSAVDFTFRAKDDKKKKLSESLSKKPQFDFTGDYFRMTLKKCCAAAGVIIRFIEDDSDEWNGNYVFLVKCYYEGTGISNEKLAQRHTDVEKWLHKIDEKIEKEYMKICKILKPYISKVIDDEVVNTLNFFQDFYGKDKKNYVAKVRIRFYYDCELCLLGVMAKLDSVQPDIREGFAQMENKNFTKAQFKRIVKEICMEKKINVIFFDLKISWDIGFGCEFTFMK